MPVEPVLLAEQVDQSEPDFLTGQFQAFWDGTSELRGEHDLASALRWARSVSDRVVVVVGMTEYSAGAVAIAGLPQLGALEQAPFPRRRWFLPPTGELPRVWVRWHCSHEATCDVVLAELASHGSALEVKPGPAPKTVDAIYQPESLDHDLEAQAFADYGRMFRGEKSVGEPLDEGPGLPRTVLRNSVSVEVLRAGSAPAS